MDKSLGKQLLIILIKLLLLIMFFQVLTLVAGLIVGTLLNQVYPVLDFKSAQAFTASNVATIAMIAGTFVMAWFMYKNKLKTTVAAFVVTIPVFTIWALVLLFCK